MHTNKKAKVFAILFERGPQKIVKTTSNRYECENADRDRLPNVGKSSFINNVTNANVNL